MIKRHNEHDSAQDSENLTYGGHLVCLLLPSVTQKKIISVLSNIDLINYLTTLVNIWGSVF